MAAKYDPLNVKQELKNAVKTEEIERESDSEDEKYGPAHNTRSCTDFQKLLDVHKEETAELIQTLKMAEGKDLKMRSFHGTEDEDGQRWLKRFDQWCTFKGHTAKQKLGSLQYLLEGKALDWLEGLDENSTKTYEALEKAFKGRYCPTEEERFLRLEKLFNMHQDDGESVQDFLSRFRRAAMALKFDPTMTQEAAVARLEPSIRKEIVLRKPDTWEALIATAKLVELSLGKISQPAVNVIRQQDTELVAAINAMTNRLDCMEIRFAEQQQQQVRFPDHNRYRADSRERYRGDDHSNSGNGYSNSSYRGGGYDSHSRRDDSRDRRGDRRDDSRDRRGDRRDDSRERRGDRRDDSRERRGDRRDSSRERRDERDDRRQDDNADQRSSCKHCGVSNHTSAECRYKNDKCQICSKKGHTARVCFSARRFFKLE